MSSFLDVAIFLVLVSTLLLASLATRCVLAIDLSHTRVLRLTIWMGKLEMVYLRNLLPSLHICILFGEPEMVKT